MKAAEKRAEDLAAKVKDLEAKLEAANKALKDKDGSLADKDKERLQTIKDLEVSREQGHIKKTVSIFDCF